jgi:hypothetical protein
MKAAFGKNSRQKNQDLGSRNRDRDRACFKDTALRGKAELATMGDFQKL